MAFTAAQVMTTASAALNDTGAVRWPAKDLLDYLNAGLRDIVTIKPNAKSETRTLTLVAGVTQTLPADVSAASSFSHNIAVDDSIGPVVQELNGRALMDRQLPGWPSPATLPRSVIVANVIYDITVPREFLVVPGNTGTGRIAAVVGVFADPVAAPVTNPELIASYTGVVDLHDEYRNALVDYMLYRAFMKDAAVPNAQGRAAAHMQAFVQALTGKFQAESTMAVPSTSGTAKTG